MFPCVPTKPEGPRGRLNYFKENSVSDISIGAVGIRPVDTVRKQKTILGHPPGLFLLFFTEMWERFSYYGMRALLVLYMVDHLIKGIRDGSIHVLGFGLLENAIQSVAGPQAIQPLASYIYGFYTALVYLTPVFGG